MAQRRVRPQLVIIISISGSTRFQGKGAPGVVILHLNASREEAAWRVIAWSGPCACTEERASGGAIQQCANENKERHSQPRFKLTLVAAATHLAHRVSAPARWLASSQHSAAI